MIVDIPLFLKIDRFLLYKHKYTQQLQEPFCNNYLPVRTYSETWQKQKKCFLQANDSNTNS